MASHTKCAEQHQIFRLTISLQPACKLCAVAHVRVTRYLRLTAGCFLICRWDNVEELSAAAAHKKVAFENDPVSNDPLEQFCDDNPDADECRVYDD